MNKRVSFDLEDLVEMLEGLDLESRLDDDHVFRITTSSAEHPNGEVTTIIKGQVDDQPLETAMHELGTIISNLSNAIDENKSGEVLMQYLGINDPINLINTELFMRETIEKNKKDNFRTIVEILLSEKMSAPLKVLTLVTLGEVFQIDNAKAFNELINQQRLLPALSGYIAQNTTIESNIRNARKMLNLLMEAIPNDRETVTKVKAMEEALNDVEKFRENNMKKDKENKEVLYQ